MAESAAKYIPRMRTASGIVATLTELDPGTDVTVNLVRQIIKDGAVPVCYVEDLIHDYHSVTALALTPQRQNKVYIIIFYRKLTEKSRALLKFIKKITPHFPVMK